MNNHTVSEKWNKLDYTLFIVFFYLAIGKLSKSFLLYYRIDEPFAENKAILLFFTSFVFFITIFLIYNKIISIIKRKYQYHSKKLVELLGFLLVIGTFIIFISTGILDYFDTIYSQIPPLRLYLIRDLIEGTLFIVLCFLLLRRRYRQIIQASEKPFPLDIEPTTRN